MGTLVYSMKIQHDEYKNENRQEIRQQKRIGSGTKIRERIKEKKTV